MISQKRLENLKNDLIEIEVKVQFPIRIIPRYGYNVCPIANFAPTLKYMNFQWGETLFLKDADSGETSYCPVPSNYDKGTTWWESLSYRTKERYNNELAKWLKNRKLEIVTNKCTKRTEGA